MRATSHAPPETSIATRSVRSKLAASASGPSAAIFTPPAERTTPSSQIATSQKSRCKSRPIARPVHRCKGCTCCTTNHLPNESTTTGEAAGERHRPIRARGTIRASRRGGHRKARARSHRPKRPADCVLPRDPCPGSPDRTHGAGQSPRAPIFMPRDPAVLATAGAMPAFERERRRGAALMRRSGSGWSSVATGTRRVHRHHHAPARVACRFP
jgi:hypothetical protein